MFHFSMNISSNASWSNNDDFLKDKLPKILAYCLVFLLSLVGNSFIIGAIRNDNRLKTTTNVLVANMALSDLLNSVFAIPMRVYEIFYNQEWVIGGKVGLALCKFVYFPPSCSLYVSMLSCVFIAIDRYYAVARPLKTTLSRSRLKYIIPGIWIFALSISFPFIYHMNLSTAYGKRMKCIYEDLSFQPFMYAVLASMSLLILVVTIIYALIVIKLRQHNIPGEHNDSIRRRRDQQNKKVLKMAAVVSASLCLTVVWLGVLIPSFSNQEEFSFILFVGLFVLQLSACYNFVIYLIFNAIYRQNVKAILSKCCCVNNVEPLVLQGAVARMNTLPTVS